SDDAGAWASDDAGAWASDDAGAWASDDARPRYLPLVGTIVTAMSNCSTQARASLASVVINVALRAAAAAT
ncbi:MAG: hypothetical protein ACRDU8_05600, partial [Egibacteraceae bacterium]